jgi:hypothetical protein
MNGPVTVSWNIIGNNNRFTLADDANGKLLKQREITGSGSAKLSGTGALHLNLLVDQGAAKPKEYALSQNYPNPFNPSTHFLASLPQTSHLEIMVYNVLGQKVTTLVDEVKEAGNYTITWNGTTQSNTMAASGIYFVRMTADKFTAVRKIVMMK